VYTGLQFCPVKCGRCCLGGSVILNRKDRYEGSLEHGREDHESGEGGNKRAALLKLGEDARD
jgi:hypothetical protein